MVCRLTRTGEINRARRRGGILSVVCDPARIVRKIVVPEEIVVDLEVIIRGVSEARNHGRSDNVVEVVVADNPIAMAARCRAAAALNPLAMLARQIVTGVL